MAISTGEVLYPPESNPSNEPIADVDYATGLIRYWLPYPAFRTVLNKPGAEYDNNERYIAEVLTHESVHVLQLILTGFGYDFSYRLFEIVAAACRDGKSLEELYERRAQYADAMNPLFDTLLRSGPDGVTPIAIMESAAFLGQKLSHQDLGPAGYDRAMTDELVDGEYRLAYDIAASYLGADVLHQFPHIANLALCTSAPESVFIPLLEGFRDGASRLDTRHNHRIGLELLRQQYRDILLGTAMDQLAMGKRHPILARAVIRLNDLANSGILEPITLIEHGRAYDEETASALPLIMIFPPAVRPGRVTFHLPPRWMDQEAADPLLHPNGLQFVAAASMILQQDLPDIEPQPLRPSTVDVGSLQLDMGVLARLGVITRENRNQSTIDRMSQLLSEAAEDPRLARTLRGTQFITFPDEEFPGRSPLLDEPVQAFLRDLFLAIPHLLYFLADTPEASAILEAAVAFSPEAVVEHDDGGFEVNFTLEVALGIARMLQDAASFARRQGESSSVVLGHVRAVPMEFRDPLRTLVLQS